MNVAANLERTAFFFPVVRSFLRITSAGADDLHTRKMATKQLQCLRRLFAGSFLLFSSLTLIGAAHATGQIIGLVTQGGETHEMALPPSQNATPAVAFVSAAEIDRKHIALVDYSNLYCLDTETASVRVVPRPRALTGQWVPTGLAYRQNTHALYIANYRGDNIIEGSLDCSKGEFLMKSAISSPETVSPENVAISDDGKTLGIGEL